MGMLSGEQLEDYSRDGYVMLEGLFDEEEMALLFDTAQSDPAFEDHSMGLDDGSGGISKLALWFTAGDDIYGMFSRCHRVVDTMEQLIGSQVYHYHSKMMLKEPQTGGAWTWHQDYGYWYKAGYLYPAMASCLIALDRASRENGCLQVLKGSHQMGRIDHILTGDQTGAEPGRLEIALQEFPLVYCEMEPGSALFFHGNLLHSSAQNKSAHPRWSLICCYTATHNTPHNEPHHPGYQPLGKVPDSAIKESRRRAFSQRTVFLSPDDIK